MTQVKNGQTNPDLIFQQMNYFIQPGTVIELRAFSFQDPGKNWRPYDVTGYYDDLKKLVQDAYSLTTKGKAKAVYFTLNPVNDALLARACNRFQRTEKGGSTSDHDITRRVYFPLDFDPARPAKVSSTSGEKKKSHSTALKVKNFLSEQGWPEPVFADSGNGYHLLYSIDLPVDDQELLHNCLKALASRFDSEYVHIDQTVFNPARIWKLYGTWARKGEHFIHTHSPEKSRPHRLASILSYPCEKKEDFHQNIVTKEQLEALALLAEESTTKEKKIQQKKVFTKSSRQSPKNPSISWDLAEWLKTNNVPVHGPDPWKGSGRRWVFDVCPWNADHIDRSAFIAQQPTGEISAGCQHNGCQGKDWHDLRDIYEPGWREKKKKRQKAKQTNTPLDPDEVRTAEQARLLFNPGRTTHQGNAERLIEQYGKDIHFNKEWGWMAWNGKKWAVDEGVEQQLYVEMTRSLFLQAASETDSQRRDELWKWGKRSEDSSVLMGTLKMASGIKGVRKKTSDFDNDPFLLCVSNGTLNLQKGELQPFKRSDLITKQVQIPYLEDASCPVFRRFLDDIFFGDTLMIDFIQKAVGYSLTGSTREHCIFILHGSGRNGKSTLINVLMWLLGELGKSVQPESLTVRYNHQNALVENADLAGSRLVSAVETEENKRLAEARIKQMTGGDTMKGCFKYKHPFDFIPIWKLWYATNHQPTIQGTDEGIWSRIRLIPFLRYFQEHERDHELGDKLKAELPGILAWAVEGCLRWLQEGLKPPQKVINATNDYRQEQDTLAAFLADCCVQSKNATATAKELYERYTEWCEENGEKVSLSKKKLGQVLRERGFRQQKWGGGKRGWSGIGLYAKNYS